MMMVVVAVFCAISAFPSVASADTIDGLFDKTGALSSGTIMNLTVVGRGGVPGSGVGAVALNVTVTNPTSAAFVTVWPAGAAEPLASNLNFTPGQTIPNMVVVPVGAGGQVSIYNSNGSTDVVVDVLGWFPAGGDFTGLTPARLLDTRSAHATVDGAFNGIGALHDSETFALSTSGRGGLPATGVGAVALNVTVTNPTGAGYLTVYPSGATRPLASNLNFTPGQTIPNMVLVPVSASGQVSIFNSAGSADVVVDVLGWFPASGAFTGLTPARLLDTRGGQATADGAFNGVGAIGTARVLDVPMFGRGGVPAGGVGAVALNVTVTNPTGAGFVTVFPSGASRPLASNLNFTPGQTIPNMVLVPVGANGQVSIFNSAGATDVVVDVLGWFPAAGAFTGLTPARLLDTRVPAPPPPPPPPTVLTFNPGTHPVNSDIPPGRYIANAKNGCYWERLSGFGGTTSEILANDFQTFNGPAIVDVLATDVGFKFDADCGKFQTYTPPPAPATTIVPGAHVVGADILPGTYTTNAASGCYWERTTSFTGQLGSIIANDFNNAGGVTVVTIAPSDVGFTADLDCGIWTRL